MEGISTNFCTILHKNHGLPGIFSVIHPQPSTISRGLAIVTFVTIADFALGPDAETGLFRDRGIVGEKSATSSADIKDHYDSH